MAAAAAAVRETDSGAEAHSCEPGARRRGRGQKASPWGPRPGPPVSHRPGAWAGARAGLRPKAPRGAAGPTRAPPPAAPRRPGPGPAASGASALEPRRPWDARPPTTPSPKPRDPVSCDSLHHSRPPGPEGWGWAQGWGPTEDRRKGGGRWTGAPRRTQRGDWRHYPVPTLGPRTQCPSPPPSHGGYGGAPAPVEVDRERPEPSRPRRKESDLVPGGGGPATDRDTLRPSPHGSR